MSIQPIKNILHIKWPRLSNQRLYIGNAANIALYKDYMHVICSVIQVDPNKRMMTALKFISLWSGQQASQFSDQNYSQIAWYKKNTLFYNHKHNKVQTQKLENTLQGLIGFFLFFREVGWCPILLTTHMTQCFQVTKFCALIMLFYSLFVVYILDLHSRP